MTEPTYVREERQMRYDVKILTRDEVTCRGSMIDFKVGQPHNISKMTRACATWGTGITGVTRSRHPSQHRIFSNSPSRSSYATICSVSRSPRTNNISTTTSPTSPPVLPPVSSYSTSPISLQSCQQYQESLVPEGDASVLKGLRFWPTGID
jgi:hypothetical protein